AADTLWRLLENILDFKKLESGKFRLLRQRLDISQLVESTVADFQPLAERASVMIKCECLSRPTVDADGQRLVQVLENLLSNAVKFSPSGAQVSVTVFVPDQTRVRVEVSDIGPGIALEDQDRLFDKFQQLETPDRRARGGTGLGLAVCKAIIEAHGGRVGVISSIGQGSTFWLELKL
ncbi:MAG: HAMP domain-containing histidine kinase, partial [Cyanobacteria bacterium]|nr:HAMP domain-containing histidine kinase [Cyanobacteriota bacterium]